jgi:hypothetical protein
MDDPVRRARERKIDIEIRQLELRQALERAQRRGIGDAAARRAAEDVRPEAEDNRR